MSDTITMRHPTLPKDQEIEVPREAMPHYTAAGWQEVPAQELEKRAALKAKAAVEAAAAEKQSQTADEPEKSEPAEAPTERPARSRAKAHEKKAEES